MFLEGVNEIFLKYLSNSTGKLVVLLWTCFLKLIKNYPLNSNGHLKYQITTYFLKNIKKGTFRFQIYF